MNMKTTTMNIPTELLEKIGQNELDLPRDTLALRIDKRSTGFYTKTYLLLDGTKVEAV